MATMTYSWQCSHQTCSCDMCLLNRNPSVQRNLKLYISYGIQSDCTSGLSFCTHAYGIAIFRTNGRKHKADYQIIAGGKPFAQFNHHFRAVDLIGLHVDDKVLVPPVHASDPPAQPPTRTSMRTRIHGQEMRNGQEMRTK